MVTASGSTDRVAWDGRSVSEDAVVFVVDDDRAVRDSIAMLVRAEGLAVRTFDSARSFLAEWDHAEESCLIVDLCLPDLSGLELQERLAATADAPPIIFLTGFGTVPSAVRALKAGAMDYLEKPVDPGALLARVREGLARDRERRAELRRIMELTRREREILEQVAGGDTNKTPTRSSRRTSESAFAPWSSIARAARASSQCVRSRSSCG